MIYDPTDVSIAMDEQGCVYYRATPGQSPEWLPLHNAKVSDAPDDFTVSGPQGADEGNGDSDGIPFTRPLF